MEERSEGRLGFASVSPTLQDFEMVNYDKVVPEHPKDILDRQEQADVPLIIGTTRHDGTYVLGVVYQRFLDANGLVDDPHFLINDLIPTMLHSLGKRRKKYLY